MLHLFRYRFLQITRDFPTMFWALVFPILLGTLFYFGFGTSGLASTGEAEWDAVRVAVIHENDSSENAKAFASFLEQMDGDTLDIQNISSEKSAKKALKEEEITGIYYVQKNPSLTVSQSGVNESILTSLLESYEQNASMLQEIGRTHPEKLPQTIAAMGDYRQRTREQSLGGTQTNPIIQYFLALIGYACLSGAFLGVQASADTQANLTALGARRSITPTSKLVLVCVDLLVLFSIHFCNILILNLYIVKVLGISLGTNIPAILLVDFMGSMIGVCIGIALGCISRFSFGIKNGLTVIATLVPAFLAGLMFGNMKNIIEQHAPLINRINPAAVLSDAFYCLSIYNDKRRFFLSIITLAVMSIICLLAAFLNMRRERYDNI